MHGRAGAFSSSGAGAVAPFSFDDVSDDEGMLSRVSHSVIYAHEDKSYSGAFIASASIPWGNYEER